MARLIELLPETPVSTVATGADAPAAMTLAACRTDSQSSAEGVATTVTTVTVTLLTRR